MTYKALLEAFAEVKSAEQAVWVLDEMENMEVDSAFPFSIPGIYSKLPLLGRVGNLSVCQQRMSCFLPASEFDPIFLY